jgi:hypothetical protein
MAHAMSEKPILREARAAVFAAVCVLVAVVGHDAFSPGGVPPWLLVLSAGLLFVAVRPLTSRERGLPSILGAMAGVQLALHQVFSLAQQHAATAGAMAMPGMSGSAPATSAGGSHVLPALGTWWCGPKPPAGIENLLTAYSPTALHAAGIPVVHVSNLAVSSAGAAAHRMTPGMLAAHIVAALVAAWWLRHGEAAAWSLARALATRVTLPLGWLNRLATPTVPWTPPSSARAVFDVPDRPGPGVLLRFIVARRGPPAAAAFC